jgi:hypothetical protein
MQGKLALQHDCGMTGCGAGVRSRYWSLLIGFPSGTSVGVLTDRYKKYSAKRVKSNKI